MIKGPKKSGTPLSDGQYAEKLDRTSAEWLPLLQSIARAASGATEVQHALETVLRTVCHVTGWDLAQLWIPRPDGTLLDLNPAWYGDPTLFHAFRDASAAARFPPGTGVLGAVWESLRSRWLRDLPASADPGRLAAYRAAGLRSGLIIPVCDGADLIALLEFFSRAPRDQDERLVMLLETIGTQVGGLIVRKRTEDALRQREARLTGTIDSALDAVVVMDDTGTITDWSGHAESMFGWSRAEAIGQTLSATIVPPRYREAHEQGLKRFLATGEGPVLNRRIEISGLHRAGHEFPVELAISPISTGSSITFTAFVRDITERKRAEAVTAATHRISAAANTAGDLAELFRAIHEIVRELMPAENLYIAVSNPARNEISFPYFVDQHDPVPETRPLGRGLTEWVLRTGLPQRTTREGLAGLAEQGEIGVLGTPPMDWIGVPLRTAGRTVGVLAVQNYGEGARFGESEQRILELVSDYVAAAIERKGAQDTLREREERFRVLIENSADAIALLDRDGRVIYLSPANTRILGYAIEERVGRDLLDLIHPEDRSSLEAALREVRQAPGVQVFCHGRVRHQDGSWRSLECILTNQLDDPSVRAIVNNYRDVSERRRREEQYQQGEKLQAVGRLAGGIAHDFNNLLTAVLGCTELLLENLDPSDEVPTELTLIRDAARQGADLTRQLLAYSRTQVLDPVVFNLNRVVEQLEPLLRRLVGEHIEVRTALADDLGAVRADPGQFEQVIVNLVVNARDAMPNGGLLTIETTMTELPETRVQDHVIVPSGRYVALSVRDNGSGMDAETKAHAFEPFFTTKQLGKGTGLGLATVYGIVKQSGGFIVVDSAPELGSVFRIYLPLSEQPLREPEALATSPGHHRGRETILLVEDEAAVRTVCRKALEARGYTILSAGNGEEALAIAASHGATIHLLLSDVVMPGMGGPELASRLSNQLPGLRVLHISGYSGEAFASQGFVESRAPLLQKPFTLDELSIAVREVLDRA
jgi:two-component system cell cycle sensor histidine kinase/response regulator CckA